MDNAITSGLSIVPIADWHLVVCAQKLNLAPWPDSTLYIAADITAEYRSMEKAVAYTAVHHPVDCDIDGYCGSDLHSTGPTAHPPAQPQR